MLSAVRSRGWRGNAGPTTVRLHAALFDRAHRLPLVGGTKVGLDAFYLAGALAFRQLTAWVWRVR
jgi:hypothetical protein